MLRNTTLNLPDELVQRTKAYAAEHGTTMTALIRGFLERVTGYSANEQGLDDPLVAFSEGRLGRSEAVRAAGLRDYAQLLVALGERDLPLPMLPRHEIEAQGLLLEDLLLKRAGSSSTQPSSKTPASRTPASGTARS